MRTLLSALLATQKEASGVPYVKVEVVDSIGGVKRLDWQRLYSGSEPDSYHAATMPADGSLNRCRVDAGSLYRQRVVNPGPGSSFDSWTLVDACANAGVALTSYGASVLLFYVGTNGRTIYLRESADYGASFGSPTTIITPASAVGWLAAALKSDGTALLLYSVGGTVYRVKRSGGSWGSPAAWSNSLTSISGLSCQYWLDFNVLVTGADSQGRNKVWSTIYGDGYSETVDAWSPLREVTGASAGSSVEFRAPALAYTDTFRATFIEKYTGSESYSRPYFSYSPIAADYVDNLWREPVPLDFSGQYGLALASSTSAVWLAAPWGVWQAPLAASILDVTADVLELTSEDEPGGGRLRVVLRNDDGRYLDLSGARAVIQRGAEVRVSPGYVTASGPLVSAGPAYWLQGWEFTSGGGTASFVLHARDAWQLLDGWIARRQYAWAKDERNVFQLLSFVLARAGLELSALSSSPIITDLYPSFTIHPGESSATAVRRLLTMAPDVLFFRGDLAYVKNPQSGDAADYTFGTDHPILRGRYATLRPPANRAQVFGDGPFVEGFDWPDIEDAYDRVRQTHDLNLDTVTLAQDRASAELRHLAMASQGGSLVVPPNCGQELYDVVAITDAPAGLSAAKRRVVGLSLCYVRGGPAPAYEQRLTLGAV
jgi:hypothetical protein